jgi:hypothetical protein
MSNPLDEYSEALANQALSTSQPLAISLADCPYSLNSLRASISRQRLPVKTVLAGDSLVIMNRERRRSPSPRSTEPPTVVFENRIESKLVNQKILTAIRLLLDHCVIESFTALGVKKAEFLDEYPNCSEWFELVECDKGLILL